MTTQFLSRVERIDRNTLNIGDQDIKAAPGSYNLRDSIKHTLPNFAPFTTTSKRKSIVSSDITPAPGTYEIYSNDFNNVKHDPSSTSFRSKSDRFRSNTTDDTPAAGTYNIKSQFSLKKKSPIKKSLHKSLELIKLSNNQPIVPSIPTKNQAFGYEEDNIGTLIPQAPLIAGFSGLKSDSVGPGDYEPKVAPTVKSARQVSFGKFTTRENGFGYFLRDTSSAPGPGQYNTLSSFDLIDSNNQHSINKVNNDVNFIYQLNKAKKKQMSVFESKTIRDPLKSTSDLPGPGSYVLPSAIEIQRALPPDQQTFSSYGPRFRDIKTSSHIPPNHYNPIVSDFDQLKLKILKKKRIISSSNWANNISFNATESRFFKIDKHVTPDAIYNPKVNISDHIPKQNVRAGPFLRGGKDRFPEKKDKNLIKENPLENELNNHFKLVNNSRTSKKLPKIMKSSVFTSKVNRFDIVKDSDFITPPPNTYNVQIQWGKTTGGVKMIPELNLSKKVYEDTPGPGNYNIPSIIDSKKGYYYNPKRVMVTTSIREIYNDIKDTPPVGSYNISTSMVKPTHNIYLSDKYR